MKIKTKYLLAIALALIYALFLALLFVYIERRDGVFVAGIVFTAVSFLACEGVLCFAFRKEDVLTSYPYDVAAFGYLVVEVGACLITILLPAFRLRDALLLQIALLVAYAVAVIVIFAANRHIFVSRLEVRDAKDTMNAMLEGVEKLLAVAQDEKKGALQALHEDIVYSDPMGNAATRQAEGEILQKIAALSLSDPLFDQNIQAIRTLLDSRNKTLRRSK